MSDKNFQFSMKKFSKKLKKSKNKKEIFFKGQKNIFSFDLRLFFIILIIFIFVFIIFYVFAFKKPFIIKSDKNKQKTVSKEKIEYSFSKVRELLKLKTSLYYDPNDLINDLKKPKTEILLIDCRDKESFKKEHIKKAVFFQSIEEVLKLAKDKKSIILYGNYPDEIKVNQIALELLNKNLRVKILAVGYNQFRHLKIYYLPQSQWDKVNPDDWVEGYN